VTPGLFHIMLDIEELKEEIRKLRPRSKLFRILKKELSILGYWKNKPRGNPRRGYEVKKEREIVD
jgi:hypothetical protein